MIELKHLRTLAALQQSGTLRGAAEQLHLSVSALSHQLAELEARLAGPLFLRKSRPLQFTREGEWLLDLAAECLPRVDAVQRRLLGESEPQVEPLRLAIECHSCMHWLAPALSHWLAQAGRELDFVTGQSFEPQQALLLGAVDVVLTSDVQASADIHYAPLFDYEMRLVAAPDHPLLREEPLAPARLAQETLLSYPVDPSRLDVVRYFLAPAGESPQRIRHGENTLMLVQMAAAGWGVTVLPSWASREFEAQGLVASRALGRGLVRRLYGAVRVRERESEWHASLFEQIRTASARLV
ncbi:MAG: LysR substrate-binding domain-containing protein [Aeromonadaceae bacterium]